MRELGDDAEAGEQPDSGATGGKMLFKADECSGTKRQKLRWINDLNFICRTTERLSFLPGSSQPGGSGTVADSLCYSDETVAT